MASPMPPYNRFLASPAPTATPWQGEATFEGGLVCTYYMADLETVTRKKASFLEAGTRDVIIISDFDRTITKSFFIRTFPYYLSLSKKCARNLPRWLLKSLSNVSPSFLACAHRMFEFQTLMELNQ